MARRGDGRTRDNAWAEEFFEKGERICGIGVTKYIMFGVRVGVTLGVNLGAVG